MSPRSQLLILLLSSFAAAVAHAQRLSGVVIGGFLPQS
jgi:hypothetical protein